MFTKKTLIVSLSVLAIVGCGKNKDSRNVRAEVKGQTQEQGQELTTQPESMASETATADGDESTLRPVGSENDLNGDGYAPLPIAPNGGSKSGSMTQDEDQIGGSSVISPPLAEAKVLKAAKVKFDEAEAVKTGLKADGSLNYTSSGNDGLMAEFRSYNNKPSISVDQKEKNLKLAKGIVTAKIKKSSSGEITIDLTTDENGKLQSYKYKATENGDRYSLSQISASGALELEGGFLKCTDSDGGCENSYAKIKLSSGYARIIFRSSNADRHFITQNDVSNQSFDLWKSYIDNTVQGKVTNQKIESVQVASFEVVNGRSGMGLMLVTKDKDLVGLSMPLLAADKGTALSAQVTKLSDLSKNYDLMPLTNVYTQKLSQALKDVKLVRNNGKGDLRLVLDLSSGGQKALIALTVSKVQKSTASLAEIRSFESGLKAF